MIMYDFQCQDCGLQFEELLRSIHECSNLTCPSCQGKQIAKLPSAARGRTSGAESSSSTALSGCSPSAGFS